MKYLIVIIVVYLRVLVVSPAELDLIDCGVDHELEVMEGNVPLTQYPWLGVLFYTYYGEVGESRSVTTVALIQVEFVIAAAADIGPMPKNNFRANSKVLLGGDWRSKHRRVRNYVLHPEYGETLNTVALIQLYDPVRETKIKPLCPPPQILRNPDLYVVKFKEDYNRLEKQVIPVSHVPGSLCKEFYIRANLYSKMMRPPHVACAVSLEEDHPCVWDAGAALVSRDVWGRWQLLGLGVRGPGCGAPSRYLDMMTYYPWIEASLTKFKRLTISKITNQKYVLRSGGEGVMQRFGDCDVEEQRDLIYREMISLRTDNNQYQFLTYNMSIKDSIEFTCLTLELVNASAVSEMKVRHFCPRQPFGTACYKYLGSMFDISVYMMFSDTCRFEMFAWGQPKNMSLLDIHAWKWEEGSYYEDFNMQPVEYRGQTFMTTYGFEPVDYKIWVPEYDIWTTTEFDNSSWSSTTEVPRVSGDPSEEPAGAEGYVYKPTLATVPSTVPTPSRRTKITIRKRTRTTRTTTAPAATAAAAAPVASAATAAPVASAATAAPAAPAATAAPATPAATAAPAEPAATAAPAATDAPAAPVATAAPVVTAAPAATDAPVIEGNN